MEQARAFAALAAPWLARPGDIAMRPTSVALVLLVLIVGVSTIGYEGVAALRELLPAPQREATP